MKAFVFPDKSIYAAFNAEQAQECYAVDSGVESIGASGIALPIEVEDYQELIDFGGEDETIAQLIEGIDEPQCLVSYQDDVEGDPEGVHQPGEEHGTA